MADLAEQQLQQALDALERGDYRQARALWGRLPAAMREGDERAQRIDRQTGVDPLGLTLAIASMLGPFAMVRYGMMLFGIGLVWLISPLFRPPPHDAPPA